MLRPRFDWRSIATLALVKATRLRERALALKQPPVPVAEIVADPVQTASDHMRAAYAVLRKADPGTTQAQLFTKLRLMINGLEHGGGRRRVTTSAASRYGSGRLRSYSGTP